MLGLTLSKYGYIWFIVWVVISIIVGVIVWYLGKNSHNNKSTKKGLIVFIIMFAIGYGWAYFASWQNVNTAAGQRFMKDMESEFNHGLEREIVIYAEDGREIYKYEGKVDLKVNQDSRDLEFVDEEGKKQIIIFGVQDTAIIKEK